MSVCAAARNNKARLIAILTCVIVALSVLLPLRSGAGNEAESQDAEVIRAGWHEAPYFYVDAFGRSFGYSYEYQQKVAAYTGWNYEYVEGGWSDLLRMLKDGEIDILANVSYTEERAKDYLFADLPMGTESYYVFVSPDNQDITSGNYASLGGKTVGVAKGSIQSELFRQWAETHGVTVELKELTSTEDESILMLGEQLDAFVTMDVNADPKKAVPVWKIGSSDFFFAVNKNRPDLLGRLNAAMSKIQDENINFNRQLSDKYLKSTETNVFLSKEELDWLSAHGTIRVGYQDNYLAFCAKDSETGELTGALKEYLDYASSAFENAAPVFEAIAYPSASAALEALKNGEIDCMFPANLIPSDAETMDLVMTPALMKTEMDAVVRESEQKEFVRREKVTVAVNKGNTNYEMFLVDHYPDWEIKYYPDTPAGLEAIAAGEADCVIISNYRYSNIAKQCEKLRLTTIYTGVDMEYYLAVRRGDTLLYSILAKATSIVPESIVHTALTYYSTEDAKTTFFDVVKDYLVYILVAVIVIILIILVLLLRIIRVQRKAVKEERMINDLNRQIYFDALTHVRNKGGFDDYIDKLQSQIDQGEKMDFAIGIFDCDNLKTINDRYGHDKGNIYLTSSTRLICDVFQHSPVFRIGGDEFAAVLLGVDFENREALLRKFEDSQNTISASAADRWDQVSVAFGVAVYDPATDGSVKELIQRADKLMYENKNIRKKQTAGG